MGSTPTSAQFRPRTSPWSQPVGSSGVRLPLQILRGASFVLVQDRSIFESSKLCHGKAISHLALLFRAFQVQSVLIGTG